MARINKPIVSISYDELEAYVTLLAPDVVLGEGEYTKEEIKTAIYDAGVVYGIDDVVINMLVNEKLYGDKVCVARGNKVKEGSDGYYTYNFQTTPNRAPTEDEHGNVDYWDLNLIETVVAGQVIAEYHPAVQGTDGVTVKGNRTPAKIRRELPPLKGKGFERSEDNSTYTALIDGKVELKRDRVNVLAIHEIFGNVDMTTGNINFPGDVVIHGNICSGASVTATESVTVDGIIEDAVVEAGKDIVIRNGVKGSSGARIVAKGNVYARYIEYARVESKGVIEADSIVDSNVEAGQAIVLTGQRGKLMGGKANAIEHIEATYIGSEFGTPTSVHVGVADDVYMTIKQMELNIKEYEAELAKIETALSAFAEYERSHGVSLKDDPRRTQLLRTRIKDTALMAADKGKLKECNNIIARSRTSSVQANKKIYPNVSVGIDELIVKTKEEQEFVSFVRHNDKIIMERDF